MANTYPLLPVRGIETTSQKFREQLVSGALSFGLNPSYVAAVMSYESGFNPKAKNPYSGALGLIQWVDDDSFATVAKRAGMKGVKRSDLPNLSAEEQLPAALQWFADKPIRETSSPLDYYLAVWSPGYIGKPDSFVVAREDSADRYNGQGPTLGKVFEQNRGFWSGRIDDTGKKVITIADVARPVTDIVTAARGRTPLDVPLDPTTPNSLSSTLPSPGGAYSSPLPRPPRLPTLSDSGASSPSKPGAHRPAAGSRNAELPPAHPDPTHRSITVADLPTLKRGDHGTAVCLLQQLINLSSKREESDHELEVDGEFGSLTETEVALHQMDENLEPTGVVNAATWATFWQGHLWSLDRLGSVVPEGKR